MKTVKKVLFVCLFFFTLIKVNNALGQSHFAIAPVIGVIQGSITSNNVYNLPAARDRGYGPLIGIMGHYFLTSRWSISTGVNYHRINYRRKIPNEGQFRSNSWNVPVLVHYKPSVHAFSPYFSAGAVLSSRSPILSVAIPEPKIPTSLDIMIGAGAIYKPNSRVSWIIQPVWQKEVAPKPSNVILPNYNSYKISLQVQMLFQL